MPEKILDLHIHSRYSRACSPDLDLPKIAIVCEQKGIGISVTGDFTHPAWIRHIKENLEESSQGVYKLKSGSSSTRFILGTEISCIYKHKGITRRVHLLILAPNIEAVEKFNVILESRGVNIRSDGRPIMGLSAKAILQILLDIDPRFMMIPAHAWTPWFAVFGSKSGYNTLEECFEELTPHIRAIETGLSSDPVMNHRLSMLDNITLISNSDAHSLNNLGREANVLKLSENYTYNEITEVIKSGDKKKFLYTIEFYPEEGKYHYDGHAVCKVCLSPKESKANKLICSKCKKTVTVGVLHRVDDLADRPDFAKASTGEERKKLKDKFIPHKYIVPLKEIIAKVFGVGVSSKKVVKEYEVMIKKIGNEFAILLHKEIEEIEQVVSDKNIAVAIANMRSGNVKAKPGYDGVFGSVEVILSEKKIKEK